MDKDDWVALMVIGGLLVLLGVIALIWGKREEKAYYEALSSRSDVREFMVHQPLRSEPGAPKVGGWIAIVAGLATAGAGLIFWLNG